jgi:hypothetical protein
MKDSPTQQNTRYPFFPFSPSSCPLLTLFFLILLFRTPQCAKILPLFVIMDSLLSLPPPSALTSIYSLTFFLLPLNLVLLSYFSPTSPSALTSFTLPPLSPILPFGQYFIQLIAHSLLHLSSHTLLTPFSPSSHPLLTLFSLSFFFIS